MFVLWWARPVRECADSRSHFVIHERRLHQPRDSPSARHPGRDRGRANRDRGLDLIGGLPGTGFIAGPARPEARWQVATGVPLSNEARRCRILDLA